MVISCGFQWIDTNAEPKFRFANCFAIFCAKCDADSRRGGAVGNPKAPLAGAAAINASGTVDIILRSPKKVRAGSRRPAPAPERGSLSSQRVPRRSTACM